MLPRCWTAKAARWRSSVRDPSMDDPNDRPCVPSQSDALSRALQDLIEASAKRNPELADEAPIGLTATCVRCHVHMPRRRLATGSGVR